MQQLLTLRKKISQFFFSIDLKHFFSSLSRNDNNCTLFHQKVDQISATKIFIVICNRNYNEWNIVSIFTYRREYTFHFLIASSM